MKAARSFLALAGVAALMAASPPAAAQHHLRPPVMRFPMSAADFRRLVDFNIDLAHKHESRLSPDDRANLNRWILEMRECEAEVTADGVVTKREATRCFSINAPDPNRPPPR